MNVNEIRERLNRNYGSIVENNELAVRIPKATVFELTQSNIFHVYKVVAGRKFEALYIIADKSHVKITSQIFGELTQGKTMIEEMLRGDKGIELSDYYKDRLSRLLDTASLPEAKLLTQLRGGRRTEIVVEGMRGRTVKYKLPRLGVKKSIDVALIPTIRAAALRRGKSYGTLQVSEQDLRERVRKRHVSASIGILYDASGSIGDIKKCELIKTVIRLILANAYERRDSVALIPYRGESARVLQPLTRDMAALGMHVERIEIGGTTPLASGLWTAIDTLIRRSKRTTIPVIVLITDGTYNVTMIPGVDIHRELHEMCNKLTTANIRMLVMDISDHGSNAAKRMALWAKGLYYHVEFAQLT